MVKLGYIDRTQDPKPMLKSSASCSSRCTRSRRRSARYDTVKKAPEVGELALENKLYKSPDHSVFLIRALVGLEGITRGWESRTITGASSRMRRANPGMTASSSAITRTTRR